jgi:hypothetical protein
VGAGGAVLAHYPFNPQVILPEINFLNWWEAQKKPVGGPWHYGNWCGNGGMGVPIDGHDTNCMLHDYCLARNGLNYRDNFNPFIGETKGTAMQGCNEALCSATAGGTGPDGKINSFFSWGGGGFFDCHQ